MTSKRVLKIQIKKAWKIGDDALDQSIQDPDNEAKHLQQAERCYQRAEKLEAQR